MRHLHEHPHSPRHDRHHPHAGPGGRGTHPHFAPHGEGPDHEGPPGVDSRDDTPRRGGPRHGGFRHAGPHHHGHRHEHSRRSRRNFEAGGLRLILLILLQETPRHGYDAIREISTRSGGAYTPSPGLVYPTLSALEDLGHIEQVTAEGSKRLFTITEAGRAYLEENRAEADAAMARLEAMNAEQGWTEAGPVQRALRNLEAVLQQSLKGTPEKAALLAVADIIDEAARRIERL